MKKHNDNTLMKFMFVFVSIVLIIFFMQNTNTKRNNVQVNAQFDHVSKYAHVKM